MNITDFYNYLNKPELLTTSSLKELEEVIERYPYFQAARMLYLKNLHLLHDDRFQVTLTQTSMYMPNRRVLYHFIHGLTEETVPTTNESIITEEHHYTTEDKTEPVELTEHSSEYEETDVRNELTVEKNNYTSNELLTEPKKEELTIENNNLTADQLTTSTHTKSTIADEILKKIENLKKNSSEKKELSSVQFVVPEVPKSEIEKNEQFLSFDEWIEYISKKEFNQVHSSSNSQPDLIDQFLEKASDLTRIKPQITNNQEDLTKTMIQPEEFEIISEPLAQLYYQQRHYEKALKMYEKLFLKYPEKSIYFATLIQEIKQKLDKN